MKIFLTLLLVLSVILNVFLYKSSPDNGGHEPYRLENDHRESLVLEEKYRQHVMAEMRGFVKSMELIQEGILEKDPDLVIEGGQKSGQGAKPDPELREALTKDFLKMGMQTHQLFDAIADSAKTNFNPETTSRQLYILTTKCNACHDTFRFDPSF